MTDFDDFEFAEFEEKIPQKNENENIIQLTHEGSKQINIKTEDEINAFININENQVIPKKEINLCESDYEVKTKGNLALSNNEFSQGNFDIQVITPTIRSSILSIINRYIIKHQNSLLF